MIEMKDIVVLITGITGGIGRKTAEVFYQAGARIIGVDLRISDDLNTEYDVRELDVTNFDACRELAEDLKKNYGKIDVLINCAGINRDALTEKMTEEQFDEVVQVNLKGVWNLTKFVAPVMREKGSGSIINISSVVGVFGNIGQANYAATKAGVIGMTKSWAKEFSRKGEKIRVNAIAPGYILTPMLDSVPEKLLEQFAAKTMLGRLGKPEEVANAALFLASDLADYITGTTIHVDGGMRL